MPKLTKMERENKISERRWQAEDDARSMAQVAEIQADPPRLGRAKTSAKRMQREQQQRATALGKVAALKASPLAKKKPVGTKSKSNPKKKR